MRVVVSGGMVKKPKRKPRTSFSERVSQGVCSRYLGSDFLFFCSAQSSPYAGVIIPDR